MLVQPTAIDIHVKHFQAISFRWKHLRPGLDSGCSHQCNCLKAAAGHISLCERYFPLRLETVVGLWLIHWLAGWTLSIVLVIYIRVDCSGFVSFCIVLCLFPCWNHCGWSRHDSLYRFVNFAAVSWHATWGPELHIRRLMRMLCSDVSDVPLISAIHVNIMQYM